VRIWSYLTFLSSELLSPTNPFLMSESVLRLELFLPTTASPTCCLRRRACLSHCPSFERTSSRLSPDCPAKHFDGSPREAFVSSLSDVLHCILVGLRCRAPPTIPVGSIRIAVRLLWCRRSPLSLLPSLMISALFHHVFLLGILQCKFAFCGFLVWHHFGLAGSGVRRCPSSAFIIS